MPLGKTARISENEATKKQRDQIFRFKIYVLLAETKLNKVTLETEVNVSVQINARGSRNTVLCMDHH
jgi:hypothetical protein